MKEFVGFCILGDSTIALIVSYGVYIPSALALNNSGKMQEEKETLRFDKQCYPICKQDQRTLSATEIGCGYTQITLSNGIWAEITDNMD